MRNASAACPQGTQLVLHWEHGELALKPKFLPQIVCVNDSGGVKQASHLLKYDSTMGTFKADVKIIDDSHFSVNGKVSATFGHPGLEHPFALLVAMRRPALLSQRQGERHLLAILDSNTPSHCSVQ